jgi:trigger factor
MKVEIENLGEVKRKLMIEVPSAEVNQEVDRAYLKLGKNAKVKGFRPGKVPRSILELYYRKQVEQEVSDSLVRRSLDEALKEKALEPVSLNWPEILPQLVVGEDYRFSVELEVPPEFQVTDYLGLSLGAPEVEVTEKMVDQRLEEIRQSNAMLRPVAESRGIKEGDFVVLDYQAYFAGQPVEAGRQENYYLEVGSGKFHGEFENQLLGLTPGSETRFPVDLPPDFFNPLLAGKAVEFRVKVHEVKEKVVPDLDDAFAQGLGGNFQTIADLRQAVREDIIKVKESERQNLLENQVLDQLLARTPFEAPPSLVRQEQESIHREQWERLSQYGVNLEGMDREQMLERMQPQAERRVRGRLLLERIAAQEGLTVDEAELEDGLERIAARSGREVAQVKQFYQEHDLLAALRRTLRDEKTMKFLLNKATVATEAPASPQEAPGQENA